MADEIIKAEKQALTSFQLDKGLAEMLKPLTREIFLFDTYIAGTTHLKQKTVLYAVKKGDKLMLRRYYFCTDVPDGKRISCRAGIRQRKREPEYLEKNGGAA